MDSNFQTSTMIYYEHKQETKNQNNPHCVMSQTPAGQELNLQLCMHARLINDIMKKWMITHAFTLSRYTHKQTHTHTHTSNINS